MPVTVRLSRLFHERLGDKIADELASWFNQVDATYRGDLRELNELNFARFDAKLEQRIAEVECKLLMMLMAGIWVTNVVGFAVLLAVLGAR